jgi:hypothetical protein
MAGIPYSWDAYARLQFKLSITTSIIVDRALDAALNVVHQPEFNAELLSETDMLRMAANAARQERHRAVLRRHVQAGALDEAIAARGNDDDDVSAGAPSLDDQVHARRELEHLARQLSDDDWELLTDVAAGVSYDELANSYFSTSTALRSRVCRLRQRLMVRRLLRK